MDKLKNRVKRMLGPRNYYTIQDIYHDLKLKKRCEDLYNKVSGNRLLKDSHSGERCFILGNGPSLKDLDLRMLQDEFTFTVNYFPLLENCLDLRSKAHVMIDGAFFGLREEMKGSGPLISENYRRLEKMGCPCFVPADAYPFLSHEAYDIEFRYVRIGKNILDGIVSDVDLTKDIYTGTNVIQYVIQIAIYMGFREIYLLGCESTNILALLNTALGKDTGQVHAYAKEKDDSDNTNAQIVDHWKMSKIIYDQYLLFAGFDFWTDYCSGKGISLINCTPSSLITGMPRAQIDEVLAGENRHV